MWGSNFYLSAVDIDLTKASAKAVTISWPFCPGTESLCVGTGHLPTLGKPQVHLKPPNLASSLWKQRGCWVFPALRPQTCCADGTPDPLHHETETPRAARSIIAPLGDQSFCRYGIMALPSLAFYNMIIKSSSNTHTFIKKSVFHYHIPWKFHFTVSNTVCFILLQIQFLQTF